MKWPTIAEAWTYRDPQEIADALIGRSGKVARASGRGELVMGAPAYQQRDRYYRQARHLRIVQAMRGRR